jgi:hypothetical protein
MAGVVLAVLGYITGVFAGWFKSLPVLVSELPDLVEWLGGTSSVRRWILVGVVVLFGSATLYGAVMRRRFLQVVGYLAQIQKAQTKRSPLLDYRSDTFDGLRWRWTYRYESLKQIQDIGAFCPKCDIEVMPHIVGSSTFFRCEECAEDLGAVIHQDGNIYDRVRHMIERELRRKG